MTAVESVRRKVAHRLLNLPPEARAQAMEALAAHMGSKDRKGRKSVATRDVAARRKYFGDPWAYFADVFGFTLSTQQHEALELIERETRVLLPSGNNLGKTFVLAGYGLYAFDVVAAMPDDLHDQQGARLLLPGPDHKTVFATIYSQMLALASRAEARGYIMPGERSENSVLWRVRPMWEIEPFSPPAKVGQNVTHTASGRHHHNQIALIEEGQGVRASLWRAVEGMCSSDGNKIISSFNPTEPIGAAFERARSGSYKVLHLDAFKHPNILQRRPAIPAAVDFKVIDARVRDDCRDRGPFPGTPVEEELGDFVYALPPLNSEECGARDDGHIGHPAGELRVYRPSPTFSAQVRGQWPETNENSLFDPASWDAAVQRWKQSADPPANTADRVGTDPAREGSDDTCAAPAWGDAADALLRAYLEARDADQRNGTDSVSELLENRRARVGEIRVLPKGDGKQVAEDLVRIFGVLPFNVDSGSVGSSPIDFLRHVLKAEVAAVSFAAVPPMPPREGFLPYCENTRAWLYVSAAKLVRLGLVDVPDDPLLRQEVMAHQLEYTTRTVEIQGKKKRVPSVLVKPKDDVKKIIGRSPDRSDAFVLSLFAPPPSKLNIGLPVGFGRPSHWRT